jgi:hypothetical protein
LTLVALSSLWFIMDSTVIACCKVIREKSIGRDVLTIMIGALVFYLVTVAILGAGTVSLSVTLWKKEGCSSIWIVGCSCSFEALPNPCLPVDADVYVHCPWLVWCGACATWYLRLWGKIKKDKTVPRGFHSLSCHSLLVRLILSLWSTCWSWVAVTLVGLFFMVLGKVRGLDGREPWIGRKLMNCLISLESLNVGHLDPSISL